MPVKFETCALFDESVVQMVRRNKHIIDKIKDFESVKSANPLARYGNSDETLSPDGILSTEVPKIRHAKLTSDVSIWYTISGKDPQVIRLYGVFTHDDSGTGQPPNRKKQKALGSRMARQQFK